MRKYLAYLLATSVMSCWFFLWIFFLGYEGYAVAIPTSAGYFWVVDRNANRMG